MAGNLWGRPSTFEGFEDLGAILVVRLERRLVGVSRRCILVYLMSGAGLFPCAPVPVDVCLLAGCLGGVRLLTWGGLWLNSRRELTH